MLGLKEGNIVNIIGICPFHVELWKLSNYGKKISFPCKGTISKRGTKTHNPLISFGNEEFGLTWFKTDNEELNREILEFTLSDF